MKKILAAIDNSAAATPVLATGAALAHLYDATLEAVHVRVGEEDIGRARSLALAAGLELRVLRGATVHALLTTVEQDEAVVALVVGARGLPLGRRLVGSTAFALLTEIKKPLVVVPPQAQVAAIDRVLVPLDGTHASAIALESTIQLARAGHADVVVLHVHQRGSVPRFSDQAQHETEAWSVEFLARNCPSPRGVELALATGIPGEIVLQVAQKTEAKMIALCWSQVLSPDRAAVVREVLERSAIPVLLVPVAVPVTGT